MDGLIAFLADMPFWAWFALAGILLLAEIITGTTFLLWPAIAALILGLITTVQLDGQWATQWILFAITTVGLGLVGRPYAERWVNQSETDRPNLNQFSKKKIGMRGTIATDFVAGRGRVRLGDTEWQGKLAKDGQTISEGQSVEVVDMDGTVLIVAPVEKNG